VIPKNVGGTDRQVRGVLAAVLTAVGVAGVAGLGPLSIPVGILALGASAGLWFNVLTRRCFGNYLLGVDTCEVEA